MDMVVGAKRSHRLPALLCLVTAVCAPSAHGATFTVTTTADTVAVSPSTSASDSNGNVSLRSAVMAANAHPDADIIELQTGVTYTLAIIPPSSDTDLQDATTGDLDITAPVTINGHGSTVDAAGLDRVFAIENASDTDYAVTISDLTMTGGSPKGFQRAGGGISLRAATLTLNNCTIKGNTTARTTSPSNGGGIAANGVGVPVAVSATLNLTGCTVSGNSANNGGGIVAGNCSLTLNATTVSNNTATGLDTGSGGGGIFLTGSSTVAMIGQGSLISGNTGTTDGGGISVFSASLTVTDSTIASNLATGNGGGLYNSTISPGNVTLSGCTFYANKANQLGTGSGNGGGLFSSGNTSLTNCTFSGNTALGGGGVAGTAALNSCTITTNTATQGGGIYPGTGTMSLLNTIVAGNTTNVPANGSDAFGTVVSQGHNLIGSTTGLAFTGVSDGNLMNVAPLLGPLGYNGGYTLTHALLPGSPAIDAGPTAGFTLATDQRGISRPQDGRLTGTPVADIGAYEYVAPYTVADARRALSLAGGLLAATTADLARLNADSSDTIITVLDAIRIVRKASGLDNNP